MARPSSPARAHRRPAVVERGPEPVPARLSDFFVASARRRPDAVAVRDGADETTYRALDDRSDRLARHLRSRGAGPGTRVGILLGRSTLTYVALLGVLKSGAAFVPIDPASPTERIDYIRDDAGLDLTVTTSDLAAPLDGSLVVLDEIGDALDREPAGPVDALPDEEPDPLCYVIYTSGSSGRPKGVAVGHASICNFVDVATRLYDVRPSDRVHQGMTISFDFSIEEIWPTFAAGATLVVGPSDARRVGTELGEFLSDNGITVLACVPTLLATLPDDLPDVRTLLVGGEACPAGLVSRWARPGRRMLNTYGPTEATVTATWTELEPDRPVTIGRPVPTYSVVLLDDELAAVPDGDVGEICIGGPGVARGYVNLPDRTADRFVRHPTAPSNGDGRLYRTGDLGRVDEHGEIVYLGRADDEVKVRGHRVDLGEIDNVALEDPGVESAVASPVTVGSGDDLALYLTTAAGAPEPDALVARVHDLLRTRLPDYMVPGFVEVLDALPTMVSGKVDRSRLPAPAGPRRTRSDGPVVGPDGALERRVRDVVADAMALESGQVSVEADFFAELGGHSLLAARVVTLLRERGVGRSPAVRDLYRHPTIRALAAALDTGTDDDRSAPPSPRPEPLRHSSFRYGVAGWVQAGGLYALMLLLTLPAAVVYGVHGGQITPTVLAELAVAATVAYLGVRWLAAPVLVRLLGTGIRPGRYPLWGAVHLRLWAVDRLMAISCLPSLSGSPLAAPYLRLLGAWVGRDVHVGTSAVSVPSLLDLGDDASIGYGATLRAWTATDGWAVVAPVTVGERAHVGANAVLEPGTMIGPDAVLGAQSATAGDQYVASGQRWAGSPAVPADPDPTVAELTAAGPAPRWNGGHLALAAALVAGLELLAVATLAPAVLVVWWSLLAFGQGPALVTAVLVGPVYVLTVCVVVALGRWIVVPRSQPGLRPAHTVSGLRKWTGDKLLEMSLEYTNSLYATLYTPRWLRLLGARIGRGAEISTAAHLDPDLLTVEQGSFVADMASLGSAVHHNGWVVRRRTVVGQRAFVGNAAVVPAGSRLGDESLVGVATVPPVDGVPGDSTWLGSPPIRLPVRQHSGDYDESLTFRPSRHRVAERLGIEFLRATLPASMISVSLFLFLLGLSLVATVASPLVTVLVAPLLAFGSGVALLLATAAVKWFVVGTYRPRTEPLWSRFVRRAEFVTGLYEAAAVPALLTLLVGTPLLPPALRLLGARIGRRTHLATTYLTEFDLVEIGDDAGVGRDVSLQTHLFEDRVMKMSGVRIGERASVGDRSIVLYDAVVGAGAALDSLSLLMKGEELTPETRWRGIPAQGVTEVGPGRHRLPDADTRTDPVPASVEKAA